MYIKQNNSHSLPAGAYGILSHKLVPISKYQALFCGVGLHLSGKVLVSPILVMPALWQQPHDGLAWPSGL